MAAQGHYIKSPMMRDITDDFCFAQDQKDRG
jgi:hypothetical protein